MQLTPEFREKVRKAILDARENYSGTDASFAKKIGINSSAYSRLKKGETERILADSVWLSLAREHNVTTKTNTWKVARTKVYNELEGNLQFCQHHSKAMILIDECGIGKTFCAKHIIKGMKDAFYVDCSQGKTRQQFIRMIAKTVGIDNKGRYVDVKNNLKYCLNNILSTPIIVLDDAGYLDYPAFLELQELWNGTEDSCGWYMIGDESLQYKIDKGINSKKVGYRAIFSRFLDEYIRISPIGKEDKTAFYKELIGDVAEVNLKDKSRINSIIKKCLSKSTTLRYLKVLIQLIKNNIK
ncbi:AAA family ATPase [Tenacibaculum maritimum]|uniref:AAA family ATPase n=1 Tax=Tenacibaculum maritimum TaxID=107401 RepID=UPI003875F8E1